MNLAPIVLFVYNRPNYTKQTLDALALNAEAKDSMLYIYCDGVKENSSSDDLDKIKEVSDLCNAETRFKEVVIFKNEKNIGLANSIIKGVTEIVNKHKKIIVMEDDLITSPYFLKYLNDGLNMYQNSGNVYSINSYMFPVNFGDVTSTFLSPLATSSLGWATWDDKWEVFENVPKYKSYIQSNPSLRTRFNFGDYNYADMLDNTNSWAIRWYYSVFLRNGLGLFTTKTLTKHIGFGADATHAKDEFAQLDVFNEPMSIEYQESINIELHGKLLNHFVKPKIVVKKISLMKRIINKIRSIL